MAIPTKDNDETKPVEQPKSYYNPLGDVNAPQVEDKQYRLSKWYAEYRESDQRQRNLERQPVSGGGIGTVRPYGIPMTQDKKAELEAGVQYDVNGNEWDYKTAVTDKAGQPLPKGAEGWQPDGRAYYGEGFKGTWNKMKGIFDTYMAEGEGDKPGEIASAEYEAKQLDLADDNAWDKVKNKWKYGSMNAVLKIAGAGVMGIFDFTEAAVERPVTTYLMTLEDLANRSSWKPMGTGLNEEIAGLAGQKGYVLDFLERISPIRAVYNSWRVAESRLAGTAATFAEMREMWKNNWEVSRMGWSIGANQELLKEKFLAEVAAGGNPDLVAMDLEKPAAEFLGRAFLDLTNVVGWFAKAASYGAKMTGIADDVAKIAPDIAKALAGKGDEAVDALRATEHVDEVTEVIMKSIDDSRTSFDEEVLEFGLRKATGEARRKRAISESAIFGQWVAGVTKTPDRALGVFQNMAKMASKNPEDVKAAIAFLTDNLPRMDQVLSPSGKKFAIYMERLLMDSDGLITGKKLAEDFLKIQKTGDAQKMWMFIGSKLDDVLEESIPLLGEAIEAGVKVPASMKLLNALEIGSAKKLKNSISWFSGRAYIGTNPGVAVRGGLYDLVQSVIDTDISILTKTPTSWADISVKWLGGVEHVGLTKGFSKAEIKGLDSILSAESGYKDVASYLEAFKGASIADLMKPIAEGGRGMTKLEAIADKGLLFSARMLERLEISSSQRLIGKATDKAMKKMLRTDGAFKAVDEMVEAGLSPAAADSLIERIIGSYGDVEVVRKNLMEEVANGKIDLFSSAVWLDPATREVLDNFGLMPSVLEGLKGGKIDEVLEAIFKIKDELIAKTDGLKKQHAQAWVDAMGDANDVANGNKLLIEAIESGAPLTELMEMTGNLKMVDSQVANAWKNASDDIFYQLEKILSSTPGQEQALETLRTMRTEGAFKKVGQTFDTYTKLNKETMTDVARFAKELRKASGDDLLKMVSEIEAKYGINLSKNSGSDAANSLWEIMKVEAQTEGFKASRRRASGELDELVELLRPLVGDQIDDILAKSPAIQRAEMMERIATSFDDAIMINGEMKPAGEYIRVLIQQGDNKAVARALASMSKFASSAGDTWIFDNEIVNLFKNFGILDTNGELVETIDQLKNVDPEDMFNAFQDWRVNVKQFSRQADDLTGLLGDVFNVPVPQETADVYRAISRLIKPGSTSDIDEINMVKKFITENGTADDLAALKKIKSDDPEGFQKIGQVANELHNKLLTMLGDTSEAFNITKSGINQGKATPEMKYLLKKAGVEFQENMLTQAEAWILLQNKSPVTNSQFKKLGKVAEDILDSVTSWEHTAFLGRDGSQLGWSGMDEHRNLVKKIMEELGIDSDNIDTFLLDSGIARFGIGAGDASVLQFGDIPTKKQLDALYDLILEQGGKGRKIEIEIPGIKGYIDETIDDGLVDRIRDLSKKAKAVLDESKSAGAAVKSLIPPNDGMMTEARDIWENRNAITRAFDSLSAGVKKNFGKTSIQEGAVTEELQKAMGSWFDDAVGRVDEMRLMASKYAQGVRDFALHNYDDRQGWDALLSYTHNFHFWPSRTAEKWITQRIWQNPGLVSAYMNKRDMMQKLHADAPEWWQQSVNTNELLGLDMDNPLFFRLESLVQPIYFMGNSDFTDDKKRINWWTSMLDDIGKFSPGYFNPLIQYAIAVGLKSKEEDEAAARWAGRLIPATQLIKSISAMMGADGGKGWETDPGIRIFSGKLGPYERQRVATTLAQYVKNGDYSEEEIMDAALNHAGPAWEAAIRDQSHKYAVGNVLSTFGGINTRMRTVEDLEVEKFWTAYSRMWSMSEGMTKQELRQAMSDMNQAFPFMGALLLARKGGVERSEAYVWQVLSRVAPGKTDDLAKATGLPYDLFSKFYESKGDTSDWSQSDRDRLFAVSLDMGASLELPDQATRGEWDQASLNYTNMLDEGERVFGEGIWDRLDLAYVAMDSGINGSAEFQKYLDNNPDVEAAMAWKAEQVQRDPVLSAYYGGHKQLRDYYKGEMYQKLEDEFTSEIWKTWDTYYSYQNVGDTAGARRFKSQHPEMKAYSARKKEYMEEISNNMLAFGEQIPQGEDMRLREDFAGESQGQQDIAEFINAPETREYTISEWVDIVGQEPARIAILVYDGHLSYENIPEDIRQYYAPTANSMGMTLEELFISIGKAQR